MITTTLTVLETGPLAVIEDLGRPGHAHLGVSPSGAADRGTFRLGARLLAQGVDRAAIEITFGGLVVRASSDLTVALTGAIAAVTVDDRLVGFDGPVRVPAGATLRVGRPTVGLRTYLSVRGGIEAPATLGSRSYDALSGLGPAPLRPGDVLMVGPAPDRFPDVDHSPTRPPTMGPIELLVRPGPRSDWLADDLAAGRWVVSDRSDRIGVRLEGTSLRRTPERDGAELPSEGVVRGAVQLPPSGEPVIFLADHPVTGGYPVIGVVEEEGTDRVAQGVPGQVVRLRPVGR